jgi:hypothetical protein
MLTKPRSLADLYVKGCEVALGEGDEKIVVWVQKMNPVEHAKAVKKANAARARFLALTKDPDSDERLELAGVFLDLERDELIELLLTVERQQHQPIAMAKVADADEWKTDSYFEGLREAWFDGLAAQSLTEPDDPEVSRIKGELDRFLEQVDAEIAEHLEVHRHGLEHVSESDLLETVIAQRVKAVADAEWAQEFFRQEVLIGTRTQKDHRLRIFADLDEVDALQAEVFNALHAAFREITMDPTEGKDLAEIPPSSPSSEPSVPAPTADRSGPRIVEA